MTSLLISLNSATVSFGSSRNKAFTPYAHPHKYIVRAMLRQRSEVKNSRKWDFLHAVFECQIGNVKVDYAKLALKLGYKNERCAQDMYHRFRRAHFPERSSLNRNKPARNHKPQFRTNGELIQKKGTSSLYRDDDEVPRRRYDDDDDEDDDDENDEEEVSVKVENAEMEKAQNQFWGLGFIDLERKEEEEEEEGRIKTEPGIKKEPVVEEWIWT